MLGNIGDLFVKCMQQVTKGLLDGSVAFCERFLVRGREFGRLP